MLKEIFRGFKYAVSGNKFVIFSNFILKAIFNVSPLIFAIIWAKLIDTAINGIKNNNLTFESILIPFILYGCIEILKSIVNRLNEYFETLTFDKIETKVHAEVIGKYSSLDIQSLEDPEVNRLYQVIEDSYSWRVRYLVFTLASLLSVTILIIISTVILLGISPLILLIIVSFSIPSVVVNMKFGTIKWGLWHADADQQRKFALNRAFLFNKDNLIEASINNIAPHIVNVIRNILDTYHDKRIPVLKKRTVLMFIADLIKIIGSMLSVYILIQGTLTGKLTIGDLILGSSIFVSLSGSFNSFLYELTEAYDSGLFFTDFLKFMDLQPKVIPGKIKVDKFITPPTIEFKNVSFKYPNTKKIILKDIDLLIKPGMKIALVGENGVGKTTLIKILARFYYLNKGKILINGNDLAEIDSDSWKRNLGLLTQHFNTYQAFNVKENIQFGDISKKLKNSEILKAADNAKVTSFAKSYPSGFQQLLSIQFEGGVDPSWGQWQRIGIARTLYRNSPIIILDEPTSAIDAQAEYEIFQNINEHTEGKTVIYVSHRYSTVRNADLICVLKEGRIIESGSHKDLLKLGGEYAKNFNLQAKGYEK